MNKKAQKILQMLDKVIAYSNGNVAHLPITAEQHKIMVEAISKHKGLTASTLDPEFKKYCNIPVTIAPFG